MINTEGLKSKKNEKEKKKKGFSFNIIYPFSIPTEGETARDTEHGNVVNRTDKVEHCSGVKSTHSSCYPYMKLVGVFGAEDNIDYSQRCFNDECQNFYIGKSNISNSGLISKPTSPLKRNDATMGMVRKSD